MKRILTPIENHLYLNSRVQSLPSNSPLNLKDTSENHTANDEDL